MQKGLHGQVSEVSSETQIWKCFKNILRLSQQGIPAIVSENRVGQASSCVGAGHTLTDAPLQPLASTPQLFCWSAPGEKGHVGEREHQPSHMASRGSILGTPVPGPWWGSDLKTSEPR